MIRAVILLLAITTVCCQYPQQRASAPRYSPDPADYDDTDYAAAPPPRQSAAPPQPAFRPNSRPAPTHKPASVHYVNIGLELAGDYKFGYDTGKGNDGQSFREETRLPDGSVQGAYGYVDETGTQRIVKYTAGKEGFKVVGDTAADGAPKSSPRAAPAPQPAPEPAYRPAPAPQPAYRAAPAPQPAYRPAPAPQPAYRPAPQPAPRSQPQPSYRPPPPQSQPAYRPAPQPAYRAPEPEYRPRPSRTQQARPAPKPVQAYDEEPDYDYPNNDITERRLAPVDTSLFNYNIGTSHKN